MDSGRDKKLFRKQQGSTKRLFIATYNIRTLRTEEHLEELERKLQHIKWDIIGVSETRLLGENKTSLISGHILYQKNSDVNHHIGGVGFMVNKKIKHAAFKYHLMSERVIYIIIRLNNRYNMQIINVYAPTSSSENEKLEQVYKDIATVKQREKTHLSIVV
ncbi:hypothetical protein RN001_015307 [Aquatica leii]|uniref:Craniofacial development protein 2 n=1 Tax=Aquatica leii TaxID=1421715 RepID=A0AAN7P1M0_9COLE|nr:hypothetical protein RN001_015307 [Aquatica leii]